MNVDVSCHDACLSHCRTEGLKPSEYHRVRTYLSQFPSEESNRARTMFLTLQGSLTYTHSPHTSLITSHTSLITLPHLTHYPPTPHSLPSHTHPPLSHCILFTGMLYIRLRGRASRTLVGLGRLLRQMGKGAGTVSRVQLQQALRAFHISLTPEVRTIMAVITHTTLPEYYCLSPQDYSQLWRLLSDDGRYTNVCQSSERGKPHCDTNECSSGGREGMYSDQVIAGLLGEMSEDRKFFVRKVSFLVHA